MNQRNRKNYRKKPPPKPAPKKKTREEPLPPPFTTNYKSWIPENCPKVNLVKLSIKNKSAKKSEQESSSDIEQTSRQLSLVCPLSMKKMALPCRFSDCKHLECFDGPEYLKMIKINFESKTPNSQIKCPICMKIIIRNLCSNTVSYNWKKSKSLEPVAKKLVLDVGVAEMLKDTFSNEKKVFINQKTGSWQCKNPDKETELVDLVSPGASQDCKDLETNVENLEIITASSRIEKSIQILSEAQVSTSKQKRPRNDEQVKTITTIDLTVDGSPISITNESSNLEPTLKRHKSKGIEIDMVLINDYRTLSDPFNNHETLEDDSENLKGKLETSNHTEETILERVNSSCSCCYDQALPITDTENLDLNESMQSLKCLNIHEAFEKKVHLESGQGGEDENDDHDVEFEIECINPSEIQSMSEKFIDMNKENSNASSFEDPLGLVPMENVPLHYVEYTNEIVSNVEIKAETFTKIKKASMITTIESNLFASKSKKFYIDIELVDFGGKYSILTVSEKDYCNLYLYKMKHFDKILKIYKYYKILYLCKTDGGSEMNSSRFELLLFTDNSSELGFSDHCQYFISELCRKLELQKGLSERKVGFKIGGIEFPFLSHFKKLLLSEKMSRVCYTPCRL